MMFEKKKEETSVLKIVLIVVTTVAALAGVAVLLCHLFRKYFTIEFECDGDCDDCDGCDELEEAENEAGSVEPECCDVKEEPEV